MEITLDHISKHFHDRKRAKKAVDDVSLHLTPGVWGLLGANGSGKTTLMRIVCGIMSPTAGRVLCDGEDIRRLDGAYRDLIGYLPQDFGFYPEFTVERYLAYIAALKGIPDRTAASRIEELLARVSLTDVARKKIVKLSGGMKRRVGIAQALLNDPRFLILDEPTSGLDPGERVRFRNLLSELAQDRIVLISTHIVSDIEYIATRNAIMKDGRIADIGTTAELVSRMQGRVYECRIMPQELPSLENRLHIINLRNEPDGSISLRCLLYDGEDRRKAALYTEPLPASPRLEDLYLSLFPQETDKGGHDL